MSLIESIVSLNYHNKRYVIASITKYGVKIPILLDRDVYKALRSLGKKWYVNDKNHIFCYHGNLNQRPIFLHEIVMRLKNIEHCSSCPILHLNNIHYDNRMENLQYDQQNKDVLKSTKKKRRIINLKRHGINVDMLPTYLWYLKPDKTHGDRFIIDIPDIISWRSTASKKVSLRYKLEEAKKFLRFMRKERPDIFENYSMNGDLTKNGKIKYREYQAMIKQAGFEISEPPINNTDKFLAPDTSDLTDFETYLLYAFDPKEGSIDITSAIKNFGAFDAVVAVDINN